nr:hypothetical protein CFP56_54740 [Quercus suber]
MGLSNLWMFKEAREYWGCFCALEDFLPVLLGLVKDGSHLQYKVQFVWVNQEDDVEETGMSNAWYEVLSVLHLMAMLSLSQANLLLLPRTSSDGYQPKVSEGDWWRW